MRDDTSLPAEVEDAIAADLLRIHRDSYGTGAGRAKAFATEDTVVVILDDLELQRSEQFLIESGEGRAVVDVRNHYQQAIETTFRAAVERATGRRVVSFVSATKLDPNYVVEIFRLAPEGPPAGPDPRSAG
jgi:uncharacterized protein YbcI